VREKSVGLRTGGSRWTRGTCISSSSGEEPLECVGDGGPKLATGTNCRGEVPGAVGDIDDIVERVYEEGIPLGPGLAGGRGAA
jgi:hypothetical protein